MKESNLARRWGAQGQEPAAEGAMTRPELQLIVLPAPRAPHTAAKRRTRQRIVLDSGIYRPFRVC